MNIKLYIGLLLTFFLIAGNLYADTAIVPAFPKISASSYLLMDYNSGKILVQENIHQKLAPASLTKIMTVYVIGHELEKGTISLSDEVYISDTAYNTFGSRMFVEVNSNVKLEDLLYGVIIQSGNDASVALAEHVSGSDISFAALMNQHAENLGMNNTYFVNSSGMPVEGGGNYTTAHDLAILSQALIREHPEIYKLHVIKEYTYGEKKAITQYNRNRLLWRDQRVDGIKTGHTDEAGYCLVASAIRNNMRLISVVMGADSKNSRVKSSQTILIHGYRFFQTHKLYDAGDEVTDATIFKANTDSVGLVIEDDLYVTIPRGQYDQLESVVEIDKKIIAPVNQGLKLGVLSIVLSDENIKSVSLLANKNIPKGGIFNQLKDQIRLLLLK